jgi:acetyl-CoA carboxylase biotin carboxyl carrier protein
MIDAEMIRELAGLLDETGLTEIEIEQSGMRVKVSRGAVAVSAHSSGAAATATAAPPALAAPKDPASHPGTVKSPMVGTAYRSPSPGAAPFVESGAEVKQGQTILIIEAMKTMNQIAAPRGGRVREVFVTDGQPVEYGEPLLVIE